MVTTRVLGILALLLVAQDAQAQTAPPPVAAAPGVERSGFIIGLSLGGGKIFVPNCDGCGALAGVAAEIHLGGMLSPNFAVVADSSAIISSFSDGSSLTDARLHLAGQYFFGRMWVKGGFGLGYLSASDSNGNTTSQSNEAVSLLGAIGVEILQGRHFVLDGQGRFTAAFFQGATVSNLGLFVGVNWY